MLFLCVLKGYSTLREGIRGSFFLFLAAAAQAAPYPEPVHGDFILRNFQFASVETLPELNLHYFTLGTPVRNADGRITNSVLLLHGTNGRGTGFLTDSFAGELFGSGQPLDAGRWFIIVPDSIGHGKSSKPSDGLRNSDANDLLYAWDASRDYDPSRGLERIRAAVTAVNFEDDERNPAELGVMEREIKRVARGKYVLVPESDRTRGHASVNAATLWKDYLVELLARSTR